ncbi:Clp protease N-terminal domain-containing protein [Parafrigoribacterium humi]|uniref:Clp protease N-terminal domain-containing protein n=1 Tax=Parafrigoribacterium humi TaxID=3144664 RepID=UPI0032F07DC0
MDDLKTDGTNWAQAFRVSLARARTEARRAGSRTLEAEHLILALAAEHGSAPARLLAEIGLDHARLTDAFREERRQSLAFAGVDIALPEAKEWRGTPVWSSSAKNAIIGAHTFVTEHGRRRLTSVDLLVGILKADLGTVPRALALAGVDREALIARATA